VSDYIPVQPSTTYARISTGNYGFYDANKTFISGGNIDKIITTPPNCAFVRISMDNSLVNTEQFELGNVNTKYVPYGYSIDKLIVKNSNLEPIEKASLNFIAVEKITGKNLFNKNTVTSGYYVNYTTGLLTSSGVYVASDYIQVKPNTQYTRKVDTKCN
jgi:hypothetical protein